MSPRRRYHITDECPDSGCNNHGADPHSGCYDIPGFDVPMVPKGTGLFSVAIGTKIVKRKIDAAVALADDLTKKTAMFFSAPIAFVYNCTAHVTSYIFYFRLTDQ